MSKKRKRSNHSRPRPVPARSPAAPSGLDALRAAASASSLLRTDPAAAAAPVAPVDPGRADAQTVPSPRPPAVVAGQLEITRFNCGAVEDAEPQALGLTYWFDAPADGPVGPLTVAFAGRRTDVAGPLGPNDTFAVRATVDAVAPGSGRTALTTRVVGIPAGTWRVTATPVPPERQRSQPRDAATAQGATVFAPIARVRAPGARLGAWPALVALGTALALVVQVVLAPRFGLPATRVLSVTLVACLVGLVGAKVYYLVTHRHDPTALLVAGMSLQGFVLVSIAMLAGGAALADLPVVSVLDLVSPGLLFGMAVGRLGCFFGGCCAGRPTSSRWGLWSSDRRIGTRRIPVQLIESAVAALLGSLALVLVVMAETPRGTVFVAAVASYTLARQLLFPLRAIPRSTAYGRPVMIVASASALLVDAAVAIAR